MPRAPDRLGQVLAGGNASAQGLQRGVQRPSTSLGTNGRWVPRFRSCRAKSRRAFFSSSFRRQHRLVRGRRSAEVGDSVFGDRLEHDGRGGLLDRCSGGTEAKRENQGHAKPEGEGDRRAGQEDVAGLRRDEMFGEGVARAEHIAVEVDAALGHAGGAAGKGDQRRIVLRGVHGRHWRELGAAHFERALAEIAVEFDQTLDDMGLIHRLAEIADEARIDHRVADLRALDHGRDFARAKQRHGRHHHPAGLEHAEPRREQGIAIGPAQQHAVAGDQPFLIHQEPSDAPAECVQFGIGPAAVLVEDRQRIRRAAAEQFGRGVEPFGIIEQLEFGQQLRRRQAVTDEGIVHA